MTHALALSAPATASTGATTTLSTTHENPELCAARGRLWIKVVEARNLAVPTTHIARPYCVVEFERNELVTREALVSSGTGGAHHQNASCPVWRHEAMFDIARPDGEFIITIWDRAATTDGEAFLGMMR
ncbi:hypothetical protein BC828DRAFT_408214, partial [Blastocladiella britannica]